MEKKFEGQGGKRPLLYIPNERLLLDPQNPRLSSEYQGKEESKIKEALKKYFYLDELAQSMAKNGYFDEEPLVAIPESLPKEFQDKTYDQLKSERGYEEFLRKNDTRFIVVEGNRRLCTVKLLLSGELDSFTLEQEVRNDLINLPVIIYPKRKDVISYLGARHIIGVKKWDAYAKARYVASMREDYGLTIDEIQQSVGDTSNSARKTYACYRLIETMESEFESYDTSKAKENFSYLMLASGQGAVKEFLGLPKQWGNVSEDDPVPKEKMENLFLLFSWLFGEGKEKSKVVDESRDITGKLSPILRDADATEYLKDSRDLNEAYERCGGEGLLLIKYIKRANRDLGKCLPLLPKYYNEEVESLLIDTGRTIESINKIKK
jgi:hypothetical protein